VFAAAQEQHRLMDSELPRVDKRFVHRSARCRMSNDTLHFVQDLSTFHNPVGTIFSPQLNRDRGCFRLSEDQVNFFHEHGYLTGVGVLIDEQIEILRRELADLTDPKHPGHEFFYEYHSNESAAADHILFHALGAWRITPGFH